MAGSFDILIDGSKLLESYSAQDVKELAATGQLKPTDKIRANGTDKWIDAIKVRGIEFLDADEPRGAEDTEPNHGPDSTDSSLEATSQPEFTNPDALCNSPELAKASESTFCPAPEDLFQPSNKLQAWLEEKSREVLNRIEKANNQ